MGWLGEFFAGIPDAIVALWQFADSWRGLLVTVGSIVLTAGFILLAVRTRDRNGWLSAMCGTMGATIAGFWAFGILPSAWVYFADGRKDVLADTIIPERIAFTFGGTEYEFMANFYTVFRDVVVMAETTVAMVAFAVLCLMIQKRYPRGLAEGEERGPTSGGYK